MSIAGTNQMSQPTPVVLAESEHEHFIEHGFLLRRGLVPEDAVTTAVSALENKGSGDSSRSSTAADAMKACFTDQILAAVGELFAPEPFEWDGAIAYRPRLHDPESTWSTYSHCDMVYPTILPEFWAVSAFVFLTPVRTRGGAFMFAPGSTRRLRAHATANLAESVWGTSADEAQVGALTEHLARPGDVLFFSHFMAHSASPNLVDPQTRHALQASFIPKRGVVPGRKPTTSMSTIEKANSGRYLRERFDDDLRLPSVQVASATDDALAGGFVSGTGIRSHDVLRFEGRTHLFYVDVDKPAGVRHVSTDDWVSWQEHDALPLPTSDAITAMHVEYRFDVSLGVALAGERPSSHIWTSPDLNEWTHVAELPDLHLCRSHFVHPSRFGVREAHDHVLFFIPGDSRREVRWRCGEERGEVASWTEEGVAHVAQDGHRISDCFVRSVFDMSRFALVADLIEDGHTLPHFALSDHADHFDDPLTPLRFDSDTRPHGLRVYERASNYWLLTYRRRGPDGTDRVYWGTIDWASDPGRLNEIRTSDSLLEAFDRVGLV